MQAVNSDVTLKAEYHHSSETPHNSAKSINQTIPRASPVDQLINGAHIGALGRGLRDSELVAARGHPALDVHAQAMTSTPFRHQVNSHPRAINGVNGSGPRRGTSVTRDGSGGSALGAPSITEDERDDDSTHRLLKSRWLESEKHIATLFGPEGEIARILLKPNTQQSSDLPPTTQGSDPELPATTKKVARLIDDDYGDDVDDEDDEEGQEEDEESIENESPLKAKGRVASTNGTAIINHHLATPEGSSSSARTTVNGGNDRSDQPKTSEDVRKQLEQDKRDAAENTKRNFQSMFFTLENDRSAMLEQQKLDELDREVENEISEGANDGATSATNGSSTAAANPAQGTLGSADLGASSLTLKHLIARIDMKRDMVKASDNQLRTLISEVRKGRSKWASEDKVGQEELYEAAEKVLMELKAMSEYSQPFLQRVSKREAPDYANVIKNPMDIGTMIKKLKQMLYKSKKDFVDDLNLIWNNCFTYNRDSNHPLRRKAMQMQIATNKLTPLIPDVVVRDRAEVEAEEKRLHAMEADDSDDDDAPIMASRGRKAPKKGAKGGPTSSSRKAPPNAVTTDTATPAPDVKPLLQGSTTSLRNGFLRAESEAHDACSAGFSTPPPGFATPLVNGVHGHGAHGSQADGMDIDTAGQSVISSHTDDADEYDTEFKTWKQVTMKDRAAAATERNKLFRGEHLNLDEPAILRTKATMRRWMRQQKYTSRNDLGGEEDDANADEDAGLSTGSTTLAEGIEKEEDSTLPDYYNPVSAIPEMRSHWRWVTDGDGHTTAQSAEWLRKFPKAQYQAPQGSLNRRLDANIRQMQDTRKVCAKIGIVKQMQIQAQTYQNQFQKYEPEPMVEQDIETAVVSEDGPLLTPWVNRAAFQRSVAKIFYHAGFEDFQPSALNSATDLAADFMTRISHTLKSYHEQPRRRDDKPRYTSEEKVLHTLDENGLDIETLETYIKDDVERQNTRLSVVHERMKSFLADLLRPALGDHAGQDGVGAFNDGSDQFIGGDFAEDIDEDFFGFRELGLAAEFGLESLSVPLHLLQNRMHSQYQAQNAGPVSSAGFIFAPETQYDAISLDNVADQIGLVQDFFRSKIRANRDAPLVDDEDLPQKQRFPKPRLPPTGKISSPRKRPIREQQQAAKKRRKLLAMESEGNLAKKIPPLKLGLPNNDNGVSLDPEKMADASLAPISPPESVIGN